MERAGHGFLKHLRVGRNFQQDGSCSKLSTESGNLCTYCIQVFVWTHIQNLTAESFNITFVIFRGEKSHC